MRKLVVILAIFAAASVSAQYRKPSSAPFTGGPNQRVTDTIYIDNNADEDFLDTISFGAGSTSLYKRYMTFRNLDDSTDWLLGANRENTFIMFSDNDQRHAFQAAEVALGGALDLNAGAPGSVRVNFETGASNAGMAIYSGGATPARWLAFDGQGIRNFIGPLSFGAVGASVDVGVARVGAGILKLTNGSTGGGILNLLPVTAPGNPASGAYLYIDTADSDLKIKYSDGTVVVIGNKP